MRMRHIATVAVMALVLLLPGATTAQDLHRMVERLEAVEARLAAGDGEVQGEIAVVRDQMRSRVERLERKLDETEARLHALGLEGRALERLTSARAALEATQRSLVDELTRLAEDPSLEGLTRCLEILRPLAASENEPMLGAEELPLRAPVLSAPPLERTGVIDTAALGGPGVPAAPVIGSVPQAIQELAETVDGPVAAYELVKSLTRFELYFGAMRGGEQALREARGNDADLNQLLVELLRAKGVPARYVRGVIRISTEQAMNLLGVERPERVEQALTAAGVPYEPRFSGTGIAAFELEHVWVEAYVPWSNYRGVGLDDRGKRWVPLDASFEPHEVREGERVLEAMGFDAETFVREELEADPLSDPLVVLRQRVTEFLDQSFPGTSFGEALRSIEETPEVFGLLPASLPYEVVSVNDVSFELPEALEHTIRLVATRPDGTVVLGTTFPLARLLGKRLTLSYQTASPEDREIADAFGGLYHTPPYLVDVRPVLRSGGVVVETGNPVPMGSPFTLRTELATPSGTLRAENEMIAGAYAAIGLSGSTPGYEEPSESKAGDLLNQRALHYLSRWNEADEILEGLTRTRVFRPVANHVVVKNHIEVEYASGDVALTFEWKGVDVDADLRPSVAIPADLDAAGDGGRRDFYLLSGLVGSDLESRVLEDDLGVASIATVKLLRLAPVVKEIDAANIDSELPTLSIEPDLLAAIEEHVHQGRVVRAPEAEVSYLAWTGAGFAVWDPSTGESAYMLSGSLAGGSTAIPPNDDPNLRDTLSDPDESTDEPSRIVAGIEKLPETDFQEGLVGRTLALPIGVYVTDADGNPVADGVPVKFETIQQGSVLYSLDFLQSGKGVTVPTANGIARARLQLGTSTRELPRFTREKPDDRYLTQVGLYHVTAEAGTVALDEPFFAFAFPDAQEANGIRHGQIRYRAGKEVRSFVLNVPAQAMWVDVVDPFQNPLSNLDVRFDVLEPQRLKATATLPDGYRNAKVLDRDDNELDSATFPTSYLGAPVYVRLGNVDATKYRIAASRTDSLYDLPPIEFLRVADDFGSEISTFPIGERAIVVFRQNGVHLNAGGHLWMGQVGEKVLEPVAFTIVALQEDYEPELGSNGKYFLRGKGTFTRREVEDAEVTPLLLQGDGRFEPETMEGAPGGFYEFDFILGATPGERLVTGKAVATLHTPWVNPDDPDDIRLLDRTTTLFGGSGYPIWGAEVTLDAQGPSPFVLDGNGHLQLDSTLSYSVLPADLDALLSAWGIGRVLRIRENGESYAEGPVPPGSVTLGTANQYDPDRVYTAELLLLPGTVSEVHSQPKTLDLFHAFLTKSNPAPILVQEVPDPNDPSQTVFATPKDADLEYFIRSHDLPLTEARVEIFDVDRAKGTTRRLGSLEGDVVQGDGKAVLPHGFVPDLANKEYAAQLVLDQPDGTILRSKPHAVMFSPLLYDVSPVVSVQFHESVAGSCFQPQPITYQLEREATVEIFFQRFGEGADPADENLTPLEERRVFSGVLGATDGVNPHLYFPQPVDVLVTDTPDNRVSSPFYRFRITAKATDDSKLEGEGAGILEIATSGGNVLPIGHTFVKGVDLFDGHLVSSSTDVSIPGRGPALEVVRTYGSGGNDAKGPMGAGWAMNYYSTLVIDECSWTVKGGDGSGQSFVRVGNEFVPQKGYHTELVKNADGSFDFFTKGRIRYHYKDVELFAGEPLYSGRPTLEFIEDPNGNKLVLEYDFQRNITSVREVFANGVEGRSLSFDYTLVRGEPRLSSVAGPMDLAITYEYDEWGNLVKATRDAREPRVEQYEYSIDNPLDRHNLVAYTDPNENRTRYEYYQIGDAFPGETPDVLAKGRGKYEWVKRVVEPEGAVTELAYDFTELNDGFFHTTVTDARGHDTFYELNLNGSPLRIEEPGGVVTEMKWSPVDIFKTQEKDANGRVTDFVYDDNANLEKETIHAGGTLEDVVTDFAYHPVFNKMTSKTVHNVDSQGQEVVQTTTFRINDGNGNLDEVIDADGKSTKYFYELNGDLSRVVGPRPGQVTEFAYDAYGNPRSTLDAEGNTTTTVYDERSRLTSSSDDLGHSLAQDFDELDRVTQSTRTDSRGASDPEVVIRDYYPGGQLRLETNGLGFTTRYQLDGLNRVVRTEDDLGLTTSMRYDGNGNVVRKTDRRGVTTVSRYDELNRLVRVDVTGRGEVSRKVSQIAYDAVGNKLYEIDLQGNRTDFEYDGLYRVTKRILPTKSAVGARHEEQFTYDRVGNRLTETDANGKTTRFAYDLLNRLVERKDAVDNTMSYQYDEAGNRTVETDVTRGLRTEVTYDLLNRPTLRVVEASAPSPFHYETTWTYFDDQHRVIETDPRGFEKTTHLDGFDRPYLVVQDTGTELLETRSFYDGNGNLKRSVDAKSHETLFDYDGLNRLKATEDAAGETTSYTYDGEGNKLSEVDRRGVPKAFTYDNLGRPTSTAVDQVLTGRGRVTTSTIGYLDGLRQRIEYDARQLPTTYQMDERGRVTRVTDPVGNEQHFEYDGVDKVAEVDKRGHRTEFTYDDLHRLIAVRDALGQRMTTTYLDSARQVVEVDKKGIEKTTQLDALGRLVSVKRANVVLEQHTYDGNNNRELSMDANGNQTRFVYDGANRLTARTDAFGTTLATTTSFRYDPVGNLLESKDGRDTGKTFDVRNTYDVLNRLETTEDGEGNVTTYEYDAEGNRTAVVEPKGPTYRTVYEYGERNELLSVALADGALYRYAYDPNLNRTSQVDGNDHEVQFTYDALNRMTSMVQDPQGFNYRTVHQYDPNGNEIQMTDPKGQVIDMSYDALNRLESKVYRLTPGDLALYTRTHRIDYDYDANDNLTRVDETKSTGSDPQVVVSSFKSYDDLDRLETETDAWGRRLTYDYDPQGNRTLLVDPDGKKTTYDFDELNRLQTLTFNDGEQVVYEYFPDGLKKHVTNPNGTTSTYTYDAADRMETISHQGPSGTIAAYVYDYDENGNRKSQIETNAGRTETTLYSYDEVNRLETVTYEAGTANAKQTTYEYDAAGNRKTEKDVVLSSSTVAKNLEYAYDAINRLNTIADNLGTGNDVSYLYDANGNTTQKTKNGTTTTFLYDIRDQLGEVRQDTSILGRYDYDYQGRRILKIGNDGRRQYTYDQLSVITEADPANATVSKYDYGMDQLVRLDNRNEGRSFFHLDILRSTVSLTDATGGDRQSIFYDAWGNERERIGASSNKFTFTGHEKDDETGLVYAKSRFYDTEIGRFLGQDTLLGEPDAPPSLHRYTYVLSRPTFLIDPTGRDGITATAGSATVNEVAVPTAAEVEVELASIESATIAAETSTGTAVVEVLGPTAAEVDTALASVETATLAAEASGGTATTVASGAAGAGGAAVIGSVAAVGVAVVVLVKTLEYEASAKLKLETETYFAYKHTLDTQIRPKKDEGVAFDPTRDKRRTEDKLKYVTYTLENPETGEVYVGRARGYGTPEQIVASRCYCHHMKALGFRNPQYDRYTVATLPVSARHADPAYQAIRGREQQRIDQFGGAWSDVGGRFQSGTRSGNPIRGVAKNNTLGRIYHEAASAAFGEVAPYTGN